MSEEDIGKSDATSDYQVIFRSTLTEADWLAWQVEAEEVDREAKEQEITKLEVEIAGLKSEAAKVRETLEKEREEIGLVKEDYEEKLSLLGTREFELNKIESELASRKEELEKGQMAAGKAGPRFDVDSILEKGKSMTAVKQNLQAYFFFRLAAYLEPHNTHALNNLAVSLFRMGFKDKAKTCVEKVLEIDPENEAALINFTRISNVKEA